MKEWPEGPAADQDAARERYTADRRAAQQAVREALRADLPAAHLGLAVVAVASTVVGVVVNALAGAAVAAAFAALFLATLAVMRLRGVRGLDAARRSYLFTFGWANWI
ncbi:hypothetical protein [Streptomyces sp. NPDC020983]|uniref:hypothetical protein n=1 Tax=Streptomyces sp. NPDC020983 TaxID=3365106 RepID=UPI0037A0675E